jgi:hypothetical protein
LHNENQTCVPDIFAFPAEHLFQTESLSGRAEAALQEMDLLTSLLCSIQMFISGSFSAWIRVEMTARAPLILFPSVLPFSLVGFQSTLLRTWLKENQICVPDIYAFPS